MTDSLQMFAKLLAVWNGEAPLATLDSILAHDYLGHVGSRDRDTALLKKDIAAYGACA